MNQVAPYGAARFIMARIPRVIVGLGCEGQDWTRQNLGAEFVK
jgi:hypothetical protein